MKLLAATLVGVGLFVLPGAARAENKPKGSFTLNGTTYRVVSALAYTTTVNDQKQTVVILADKPLKAAELKASLKKHGNGEDFDPYPRLELVFNDKGEFLTLHIQTQDAGIKHLSAGDIKDCKASATVTETSIKGSAVTQGNEDRVAINRHKYRFDVSFEVSLTKP